MKTLHVLMLSGAILCAAWILKPVPVEEPRPLSQKELERREGLDRFMSEAVQEENVKRCATALGKTYDTLIFDQLNPKQKNEYSKCLHPEVTRGWMRLTWDKICGI
ncbi:MAG: hypothetical protein ACREMY_20580, partial [bacterium]